MQKPDKQYKHVREAILSWYDSQVSKGSLRGIVRLHICLPYATRGVGLDDFNPGVIKFVFVWESMCERYEFV